jgi:hypothetical protein
VVCAQSRILFDGTPQNELEIILSFEQLEKVVEVLEALGNDQRKRLLENAKGPPHIVCVFGPYDSRKRRKVSPGGLARPERRFVNAVKIKTEGGNKMFTFDVTGTIKAVVDETENSDEVREKIKRAVEGALRNATANIFYNDKNVTVEVMVAEQRHVALRA